MSWYSKVVSVVKFDKVSGFDIAAFILLQSQV